MAALHLLLQRRHHRLAVEGAALLAEHDLEGEVQQQVAQLVAQRRARRRPRSRPPPRGSPPGGSGAASGGSGRHPRGSGRAGTRPARGRGRGPRAAGRCGVGPLAGCSQSAYTTSLVSDPSTDFPVPRVGRGPPRPAARQRPLRPASAGPGRAARPHGQGRTPTAWGWGRWCGASPRCPASDGPWAFGVATVAEGEELRALGWGGRILVFSPAPPGELRARGGRGGLTLCLSEPGGAGALGASSARSRAAARAFHLEIDTGMGRAGFPWADAARWGPEVGRARARAARVGGVLHPLPLGRRARPRPHGRAVGALPRGARGSPAAARRLPRVVHVANSAAALRRGGYEATSRGPGIFLYGGDGRAAARSRGPVVAVRARLALVREVPAGSTRGLRRHVPRRGRGALGHARPSATATASRAPSRRVAERCWCAASACRSSAGSPWT